MYSASSLLRINIRTRKLWPIYINEMTCVSAATWPGPATVTKYDNKRHTAWDIYQLPTCRQVFRSDWSLLLFHRASKLSIIWFCCCCCWCCLFVYGLWSSRPVPVNESNGCACALNRPTEKHTQNEEDRKTTAKPNKPKCILYIYVRNSETSTTEDIRRNKCRCMPL